ncbi:RNA polymerase sigma-70 factor [Mucilaginibacter conchicola]|uniref:RNA polymerase sigma-70 factor n=1 Tax=Mucilaginibacter conchicola TaxID=2303333 RepID=A0A372NSE2_9SPHI|nr:RNA polymerase sigma-70 factor [Mucilaginibacter conchicola]RFZ91183.1 RNA polymerase sigma-70 factor [Mucilaginibacter conchicola]
MNTSGISSLSDNDLLTMIVNGDSSAFKELFDRYNALLFIYAHKKIKDKEASQDLVQDVFATIWQNRSRLNIEHGTVASYLYASVRNRVINVFRDRKIDERHLSSLQNLIRPLNNNTDHRVRERDISRLIDKEIAALPPKMREVFELRRKGHMSNKEIALQLGISELTVATHQKRALRILRIKLGLLSYLIFLLKFHLYLFH